MVSRNPPMTVKRLREFVKDYVPSFPNWTAVKNEYFIRVKGPVAQVIGFEALRSGAYRPSHCIRILVAPQATMLHQFLDIKFREVFATEHRMKIGLVIEAMKEQFIPAIRSPLVPKEVLGLCEDSSRQRIVDAYALAALNAVCRKKERAIEWLEVLSRLTEQPNRELYQWEREYLEFGNELRCQMEVNKEQIYLDEIRAVELAKFIPQ